MSQTPTPSGQSQDERAAFEAEQVRQVAECSYGRHRPWLERTGDGYQNPLINAAWQGWKARASMAGPAPLAYARLLEIATEYMASPDGWSLQEFARIIEAAHGIGSKT